MNLKDLCNSVIEAAGKAPNRPYIYSGPDNEDTRIFINNEKFWVAEVRLERDGEFLVTAANSAEKLAEAVLVLMEALENIKDGPSIPQTDLITRTPKSIMQYIAEWSQEQADKAIQEANALVGGEG